jgi:carbon starvation protein
MGINVLIPLIVAIVLFYAAYRYYAPFIARVFEENDSNPTPAVSINDRKDYVPTKTVVLFGHHFAAVAGAGPIIGPTVGLIFGVIPCLLWLIFGTIFIGAVHDYSALFASMKEQGKSMAKVAETSLGKPGFIILISFTIFLLLLVTSAFLGLAAVALTSIVPISELGLDASQTMLPTLTRDGVPMAPVGAIAATSVIVITLAAPLVGYLLYRKGVSGLTASLLAIAVCLLSIECGMVYPVTFGYTFWMIALSIYVFLAAGAPVWIILQPRDFTNSFILFGGVIVLTVGGIAAGIKGITFSAPAFNLTQGTAQLGPVWPFLFITIACGAISGFHALVAGGTSSKQISRESAAKTVGYGSMILEALFSVGVVIAVGCGLNFSRYIQIVFPTDPAIQSNPVLAFSMGVGGMLERSLGIPSSYGTVFGTLLIAGFLATTIDAAVRLNRYLLEELWASLFHQPPALLRSYFFNSFLCVGTMFLLGYTNAFLSIWPIFGSANQLLAALTLLGIAVWLYRKGKQYLFLIYPALFMMVTALLALVYLLLKVYGPEGNVTLIAVDLILIGLALGVVFLTLKTFLSKPVPAPITAPPNRPT